MNFHMLHCVSEICNGEEKVRAHTRHNNKTEKKEMKKENKTRAEKTRVE